MEVIESNDMKPIVLTTPNYMQPNKIASVLDVNVSCFQNYNSPGNPLQVNLLDWLNSKVENQAVDFIRSLPDKEEQNRIKAKLTAITPSGIFSYRAENNLIKHSGLIQFDIDYKENTHITNYRELKSEISKIKNVAYCGLSVSGTGLWGLIPIAYTEKHREHFDALKINFKQLGIVIDEKPKNVASLRGYSYDNEAFFNHNAEKYFALYQQSTSLIQSKLKRQMTITKTQSFVEACLSEIVKNKIDITDSYQSWFEIGCSLSAEFGEAGRYYFHIVSQYYPHYKHIEADRQFTECLKHNYKFTIATFFLYCRDYNICYRK